MCIIAQDYYKNPDVLFLSQDLLGKYLYTQIDGIITGGMITETEAYKGPEDRASHAYGNRRTPRNEVMYHEGGVAYVYICYGIHSLFNVVTNEEDIPHAILIRAIEPEEGIEWMIKRRHKKSKDRTLTNGPGSLSQALGIARVHNGLQLSGSAIWLEDRGVTVPHTKIIKGPRIGIDYAGEDALLPWRYRVA